MNTGILTQQQGPVSPPYQLLGGMAPVPVPDRPNHPEAAAWAGRVVANGGSVGNTTFRAVTDFCLAIDRAGIRPLILRANLFCGTGLQACLVPLYTSASANGPTLGFATDTNVNFVSSDYVETGTTGGLFSGVSNSTKYLRTGFDPYFAGLSHINSHISIYSRDQITANARIEAGNSSVLPTSFGLILFGGVNLIYYRSGGGSNAGLEASAWAGANRSGHVMTVRNSNTALLFRNGVNLAATATVTNNEVWGNGVADAVRNFSPGQVTIFCRNLNWGATYDGFLSARLQAYSFGRAMTEQQAAAYYAAMQAFQTALGRQL